MNSECNSGGSNAGNACCCNFLLHDNVCESRSSCTSCNRNEGKGLRGVAMVVNEGNEQEQENRREVKEKS